MEAELKPIWVIGCIDSYGAIEAKEIFSGDYSMHSIDTARGHKWRWGMQEQRYVQPRGNSDLTIDEQYAVHDWLVKNGYVTE